AGRSDEARREVETRRPSRVLLDIWLQGSELDGLQILKRIKDHHEEIPVLMMSGHGTIETAVTAIKDGAYDFIEKPFKADRLLLLVERAIEAAELRRENRELRYHAGIDTDLIGRSRAMRELNQSIDQAAPTNSRILIAGPAGAGKEAVARAVHARSKRAGGPFVVVNCASMTPDRMERELFGAEAAAAGEAGASRVGMFEAAHGGTLLLDEVADLPLETQGKLVRVLQDQVFHRVGGTTRVEVDVRVLATTSRNLPDEVSDKRFREDLFYRLNVVPLAVPSLTQRREDVPDLAQYFLQRACNANGQPVRDFTADAIAALQGHRWPGNVRELKNIVERMLILALGAGDQISAAALPAEITGEMPSDRGADRRREVMGMSLREAREVFERDYLAQQLARFEGNISKTAEFIGMERSALHRKLKSLDVPIPDKSDDG
ncbi:MAG: sigma-54 dependent transcriptional regulator, partial [Rhodospirillaceae bacterium]